MIAKVSKEEADKAGKEIAPKAKRKVRKRNVSND
jgi:hypothetical protein